MRTEREEESLDQVIDAYKTIYQYNISKTTGEYCAYDLTVTGRTIGVIEVKERTINPIELLKYKDELYLQKDKYDKLKQYNAIYCNYFNYGDIKLIFNWDINKLVNSNSYLEEMTNTQDFGYQEKVLKNVLKLSIKNSFCMLKYKDYDWKIISTKKGINQIKNAIDNMLLK